MKRIITMNFLLVLAFSMAFVACRDPKTNIITGAVTDIDGNTYDAVKIGDQIWMKDNLAVSRLRDSTPLGDKRYVQKPYGSYYNNKLIKNDTVASQLCPEGWHIPTKTEWENLIDAVSGNSKWISTSGNVAVSMSSAPQGVEDDSAKTYNTSGFSSMSGGYRMTMASFPPTHSSQDMFETGKNGYYWSSTINEENMDPYAVCIDVEKGTVKLMKTMQTYPIPSNTWPPHVGVIYSNICISVRCVKD